MYMYFASLLRLRFAEVDELLHLLQSGLLTLCELWLQSHILIVTIHVTNQTITGQRVHMVVPV